MSGFTVQVVSGQVVLQARTRPDGSYAQELDVAPARRTPVGPPEKITVGTGAVSALSPPGGATHAELFVEAASDIRYYDDGTSPTTGATGNGATVPATGAAEINLASFANWKMIAVTASVVVQVLYYRYGS